MVFKTDRCQNYLVTRSNFKMANQNNRRDFSSLIAGLTRIFKSADSEAVADLMDKIEGPSFPDQFNQNDKGTNARDVNLGPAESMSGRGAEKFTSDYSKDTAQPAGSLADAYQRFAEVLADQGKRVESVEKAVTAIAGLISAAVKGEKFPEDETKEKGDEDEKEESAKSALPVMNVPSLMRALSGASRDTGRTGLTSPPSMAVVKAGNVWDSEIADADARGDFSQVLKLRTMRMRSQAIANGAVMPDNARNNSDLFLPGVGTSRHGF
jgi:hypothetical protein